MALRLPLDVINQTQGFGDRPDYYKQFGQKGHNGYDFACNVGTAVRASDDGVIAFEGVGRIGAGGYQGWVGAEAGVYCMVKHADVITGYAHLSSTIINIGDRVKKGDIIGYSGVTGVVQGAHLHWEVFPFAPNFQNGYAGRINPAPYIGNSSGGGNNMNEKGMSPAFIRRVYYMVANATPTQQEVDFHMAKSNPESFINGFGDNPLWKAVAVERDAERTAKETAVKERNTAQTALTKANEEIERLKRELANGGSTSGKFKKVLSSGQDLYLKED